MPAIQELRPRQERSPNFFARTFQQGKKAITEVEVFKKAINTVREFSPKLSTLQFTIFTAPSRNGNQRAKEAVFYPSQRLPEVSVTSLPSVRKQISEVKPVETKVKVERKRKEKRPHWTEYSLEDIEKRKAQHKVGKDGHIYDAFGERVDRPRRSAEEIYAKLQKVRISRVKVDGKIRKLKRNDFGWLFPGQGNFVGKKIEKVPIATLIKAKEKSRWRLPRNRVLPTAAFVTLAFASLFHKEAPAVLAGNIPLPTRSSESGIIFNAGTVQKDKVFLTDTQRQQLLTGFVNEWRNGIMLEDGKKIRDKIALQMHGVGTQQQRRVEDTVLAIIARDMIDAHTGEQHDPENLTDVESLQVNFSDEDRLALEEALKTP